MNGTQRNELLEACTSPTTLPGRLDRESFHSTRVADDTFCLHLGHGFGVVFWVEAIHRSAAGIGLGLELPIRETAQRRTVGADSTDRFIQK
jgi:hypothetical protein